MRLKVIKGMKTASLLLYGFLFITCRARCQDPVASYTCLADSMPAEHIYLHCNQDYFSAGETIFFKAYLVSAYNFSQLSANLFTELLNENRQVVAKGRFPVFAGTVSGSIDLPDTLPQGPYVLRAYTPWTLNLGDEYVFKKGITVFGELNTNPGHASAPEKNNCSFLPQGGILIAGLPNNIGCSSYTSFMQPVKMSGKVLDSKGDEVAEFETSETGTGLFNFIPEKGETYTAEVVYADKSRARYKLPEVNTSGVVVDVTDKEGGKLFTIAASFPSEYRQDTLLLLAVMQNNIVAQVKLTLLNNRAEGFITTQKLDPGLMQLLLFDAKGKLLTSANTFVNASYAGVAGTIRADTINFSRKGLNVLHILFPDSIAGSFSLSVTDATDSQAEPANGNIISGLLLQPGCRSYIDPKIVLTAPEETENAVQTGEWKAEYPCRALQYKDEPYIKLKGKVLRNSNSGEAIKEDLNFIIQTKDSSHFLVSTPVLPDGRFELQSLVYEDSALFYYQLNTKKIAGRDLKIQLDTAFAKLPVPGTGNLEPWFRAAAAPLQDAAMVKMINRIRQEYIAAKAHDKTLAEVVVKARTLSKEKQLDKKYTSGPFSGGAGAKMIDVGNDAVVTGVQNIFQYLQGKIAGAIIDYNDTSHRWVVESRRSFSTSDIIMNGGNGLVDGIIYVDEVETDAEFAERLPVTEIAYVKFFPPGSLNHPGMGISCALAIYRKNGSEAKQELPSYQNSFMYPGYTPATVFTSPDYSNQDKSVPDNRTTLYWNPELVLQGSGKETRIVFYNSDNARQFRVLLEGFTTKGELVHLEKIIDK